MSGWAGMRGECPYHETISTSLAQSQRSETTVSIQAKLEVRFVVI